MDTPATMSMQEVSRLPLSFGALKPVGQVIVALEDDATAGRMAMALQAEGISSVLQVPAAEMAEQLEEWLANASGFSEFGTESSWMRRYQVLAEGGCGWLVVPAPDERTEAIIAEVGHRFAARFANKYNRFTVEDLMS